MPLANAAASSLAAEVQIRCRCIALQVERASWPTGETELCDVARGRALRLYRIQSTPALNLDLSTFIKYPSQIFIRTHKVVKVGRWSATQVLCFPTFHDVV